MHYLEKELYKLIEQDRSIFDFIEKGSLDGLWYWDLESPENEWMSEGFWQALGIDPKQKKHLASEWQNLIDPDDLDTAIRNFTAHCEDPEHAYDQIVRYKHKNGSTVWIRCRGTVIRDESGKPIRMLGAHNDVTALKISQERLENANNELLAFAGAAAQDLRGPLRTAMTFNQALEKHFENEEFPDEKANTLFQHSRKSLDRMYKLVGDLYEFATMTDGRFTIEAVSLKDMLDKVTEALQNEIDASQATIHLIKNIDLRGYKPILRQLIQNILENAIKYRDSERTLVINIDAYDSRTHWFISIEDNGIGIEKKYLERVFNSFERLHGYDEKQGSGLGLSLCRRAAEYHQGDITVSSTPNKGSKFTFSIKKKVNK